MKMKLYSSPGSCSLASSVVARELQLDVELQRVDLKTKTTASGASLYTLHPKGYVPLLELGNGTVLSEGPAILQFLADQRPDLELAPPPGSFDRYRLQEWLTFIGTELHKPWGQLFDRATSDEQKAAIRTKLATRLEFVERELGGRDYLGATRFNVADAYLFTVMRWAKWTNVPLPASLAAYVDRVRSRPAVREAMLAEGLER